MEKRNVREDTVCKLCLFYDGCEERVVRSCFTPMELDEDREVEALIESNRIDYRAEYFCYIEQNAD